jgi:DNA-binding MarR family transcriptional regulator
MHSDRPREAAGPAADRRPGEIPLLLATAFRAMNDHLHARLVELGREPLRPAHGYVFRYLADHPAATMVDVAEHLGVTKQSASKATAELAEWGYLERRAHPTDGRAQILVLTERGRDYLRLADELWAESEQQWAQIVGPDHLDAVYRDLRAYLDHIYGGHKIKVRPVW